MNPSQNLVSCAGLHGNKRPRSHYSKHVSLADHGTTELSQFVTGSVTMSSPSVTNYDLSQLIRPILYEHGRAKNLVALQLSITRLKKGDNLDHMKNARGQVILKIAVIRLSTYRRAL